jgi:hypothetical protein
LAAAICQTAPGALRRAAATAARQVVGLAQPERDQVALAAGLAHPRWEVDLRIAERVRNNPSTSLDAQRCSQTSASR